MAHTLPLGPLRCTKHVLSTSSRTRIIRTFHTSPCLAAIGPEDPRFIEVPRTKQPWAYPAPVIKGVLPAPRPIFTRHDTLEGVQAKIQASARAAATIKPSSDPRAAYKQRLAAKRRANLAEGFMELFKRKQKMDNKRTAAAKRRQVLRETVMFAPPPDHDRYTATTTLATWGLVKAPITYGPEYEAIQAVSASKRRTNRAIGKKENTIAEAVHTLYMNARNFVTTEDDLNKLVEDEFAKYADGGSIWADLGAPETINEKLAALSGGRDLMDPRGDKHVLVGQRMKKVGEIVTGGLMD